MNVATVVFHFKIFVDRVTYISPTYRFVYLPEYEKYVQVYSMKKCNITIIRMSAINYATDMPTFVSDHQVSLFCKCY